MSTYRFTAADLTRLFLSMDSQVSKPISMVIIGGSAIILAHDPSGTTKDIDTLSDISELEEAYQKAKRETGIDVKMERVTVADCPLLYETRIEQQNIAGLKNIKVYVPEKHDLALIKVIRGDENDIEGITRIHHKSGLDYKKLIKLFCDEMDHVIGNPRIIRFNFLNMIERIFGSDALKGAEVGIIKKYGKID